MGEEEDRSPGHASAQPDALVRAKDLLRIAAADEGIQLSGGLGQDTEIPLDQAFVNLTLLSQDELKTLFLRQSSFSSSCERDRCLEKLVASQEVQLQGIQLDELFSALNAGDGPSRVPSTWPNMPPQHTAPTCPRNILAMGAAGSGKSTVFLKMVEHLWSTGRLWGEKFDFVLALPLCSAAVQDAASVLHLLALKLERLEMAADEVAVVSSYFGRHPGRLCIVLDGMDECSYLACSVFLRDLLVRQRNKNVHVIVTSRSCPDAYQLAQCGKYQRQVEVTGFSSANVREYVGRVIGGEKAQAMLQELEKKLEVASLMCTPIFAALSCELYMSGKGVAVCSTALYESALLRVAERIGKETYASLRNVPAPITQTLCELGLLSFCMLAERKLVFTKSELELFSLSERARRLGLLMICRGERSCDEVQYRFCHLSLQEFLAAWYVARCLVTEEWQAVRLVERLGALDGHMSMFRHFLVALISSAHMSALVRSLWQVRCVDADAFSIETSADSGALKAFTAELLKNPGLLRTDLEMSEVRERLCCVLTVEHMEKLADVLLEKRYGRGKNGRQRVRSAMPCGREFTAELFLSVLLCLWQEQEHCPTGKVLHAALLQVDGDAAERCKCFLQPADVLSTDISAVSADCTMVSNNQYWRTGRNCVQLMVAFHEHVLYHSVTSPTRTVAFPLPMEQLRSRLDLHGVELSVSACLAVAYLLSHDWNGCTKVDLGQCFMGNAGFSHVLHDGLTKCSSLRSLHLSANGISDGKLLALTATALCDTLEVLNVSLNQGMTLGDYLLLCSALCCCKKLRWLNMTGMGVRDAPLDALSAVVEQCSRLKFLVLFGNTFVHGERERGRLRTAVKKRGVTVSKTVFDFL